jgi:hypothetical protein
MSKLYSPQEAGRIIGGDKPISIYTLARWRKLGQGPEYVRLGRQYRYPEDGLQRFLEQNRTV